jgi:hypothetical protein
MSTKRNFVTTANYNDRSSENKWLIRGFNDELKEVVGHPFVKATNVKLVSSHGYPEGRTTGCTMLALCETATGQNQAPEFDKKQMTELKFCTHYFWDPNKEECVYGMSELYLDADGKMYAVNPIYNEEEVPA